VKTTRALFDYRRLDPAAGDVYIGRADRFGRWPGSAWGNPYRVPRSAPLEQRREAVGRYLTYLHCERPDLLARVGELRGRVLRCWCGPDQLCHGDALIALAEAAETTETVEAPEKAP
jgi:Domain of unknown function (DUF4326)